MCSSDLRDVGHIHHQEGPVAVGDLSQLFEVDGTGVGRSACHDHLRTDLPDLLFQLSIVDAAIFADAVGYEVIVLAGHIHRRAVGQMTALRQVHAHNGIAQIEQGEVDGQIGRVLNYVARIFSAGSSIVNNVVTIVNYFNKLEDLLPVIGEV